MRVIILLAFVLLLLAVAGWITFSRTGTRTSINLETSQIKHDAHEMIDSGKSALQQGSERTASEPSPRIEDNVPAPNEPIRTSRTAPRPYEQVPQPAPIQSAPVQTVPPQPATPPLTR
ncbi:MAG TPA: hypothetical protein VGM76_05495 [Lacipirellulaceae bacterium]|jgi:hypothetical protein